MEGHEPKRPGTDVATAENLNRLARLLSNGAPINLKLNGRRVKLSADAKLSIDLERDPETGCAEVDIRWSVPPNEKEAPLSSGEAKRVSSSAPAPNGNQNRRQPAPHIRLKAIIAAPRI